MELLFKTIGAIGLVVISVGVIIKKEKKQDWLFIVGGLCLEVYSIYIGDLIFIILQVIFVATAGFELHKLSKKDSNNLNLTNNIKPL